MSNSCRNGFWIRAISLLLIFVTAGPGRSPTALLAQNPSGDSANSTGKTIPRQSVDSPSAEKAETNFALNSLWKDAWTLPEVIIEETPQLIEDENKAWLLLLAGGASITMHNTSADREIADNFNRHRALSSEVDKMTDFFGGPGFHFAATGLWYMMSTGSGDDFNKERSWTMLKALSVTGATTLGLKLIRNNETPNGKILAWPSGHTSSSFTVAAVLDEFYGPEVGFWSYVAAGFVGYRMMDSGDHWASDVLFGGVLGYIVGHQIAGKHMDLEIAGFEVLPYTNIHNDRSVVGISLVKQF